MKRSQMLTARDVMTRRLITVRPETTIAAAIRILVSRNIAGMPVVNDAGELVGVLSEHDCLRVLARGEYNGEGVDAMLTVAALMTAPTHVIAPGLDLFAIAEYFLTHNVRRLAVVDGERLVGLVSRRDVLRGIETMIARRGAPPAAKAREPGLYPSAAGTPPGVIAKRLE